MKNKRYRQAKKIRMRSITERFLVGGLILVCVCLVGFSLYMVIRSVGMSSLYQNADETVRQQLTQNLVEPLTEETAGGTEGQSEDEYVELEEGQLFHEGEIWQYNEEIMTFLCLGVDARSGISKEKTIGKGGQADAVMLIVVNPHTKQIEIINVNRDSMVEVELYDTEGGYAGTKTLQIALQYAYGDGRIRSCELMEQAVSDLFYGIPIHGYVALDMESIPTINDMVGGVDVVVPEDMTKYKADWYEGASIHLNGKDALLYIREREEESAELGTNLKRIERQKQYLAQFVNKLKEKTKADITFPLNLYGKVQKHMVTSFSLDEITYLASSLIGYDFSMENVSTIQGEMKMGEKNEEFYVDDEVLRKKIIETFYEKVE